MADTKIDFEKSLSELEKIIARLERGDCPLEDSITLFEEGIKYTKICREALDNAEKKIISLTQAEQEANNID